MEVGSHTDDEARQAIHELWQREYALGEEGRFAEQLACVDDLQRRYADSADPEVRAVAVRTLSGRVCAALATGDRPLAAGTIRWLSEALGREATSVVRLALAETALEVSTTIAWAALGTTGPLACIFLVPLGRWSSLSGRARIRSARERRRRMIEGIELAQRLIDAFGDSPDDALRSVGVQAVILAGATGMLLGRWQQASALFDLVFQDGGTRVATVIDLATPGRCTATERAAAIIAKMNPHTRAKAETLLRTPAPG
jgi:hypothetical protein